MNNYSARKLWNIGDYIRKNRTGSWIEFTSTDEWDAAVDKHGFTNDQILIIRQGFMGKPLENPTPQADVVMPFGVHKDKKISKLPMDYLLYLRKQEWIVKWPVVNNWLAQNKERLDKEEVDTEVALDDLKELGKALKGDY